MKEQRRAVISGGLGFLGSAMVRALAERQFLCAVLYHSATPKSAEDFARTLPGKGHTAWRVDFSEPEIVSASMKTIAEAVGPYDVLVHTAEPRLVRKQLLDTTLHEFKHRLDAGVLGAFEFLRSGARNMPNGGDIVAVTTEGVLSGAMPKKMGAYMPAKFALHGVLEVFRTELASKGIRVHEIAPGFLPGGLNSDLPSAFLSAQSKTGDTPEAIANRIISLLP